MNGLQGLREPRLLLNQGYLLDVQCLWSTLVLQQNLLEQLPNSARGILSCLRAPLNVTKIRRKKVNVMSRWPRGPVNKELHAVSRCIYGKAKDDTNLPKMRIRMRLRLRLTRRQFKAWNVWPTHGASPIN